MSASTALKISELLADDRERSERQKESVYPRVMKFSEFLPFVLEHPEVVDTAHKRAYNRAIEEGIIFAKDIKDQRLRKLYAAKKSLNTLRIYSAFEKDFFGIEETIHEFMTALKEAAQQGLMSRSLFFGKGPVGSGKTSFIKTLRLLLNGVVFYTLGVPVKESDYDPDAVEVVPQGANGNDKEIAYACCTHNCNPLYALPRHLRVPREIERARERGEVAEPLYIFMKNLISKVVLFEDADICPICQYRLKSFGNNYMDFMVVRRRFSVHKRIGTVQVTSISDPQAVDISQLIGSVDTSKMELYSTDDPRALKMTGALNLANGGIAEFIELFDAADEFLKPLNTATQEKMIPVAGRQQLVFADLFIIASSNPPGFEKFASNPNNRAMVDRTQLFNWDYNLRLEEEIKIYEKLTSREANLQGHIAPHALRVASVFAVLSRYDPEYTTLQPIDKMKLYNGEELIRDGKVADLNLYDIMKEGRDKGEGSFGISPRFIERAIENALGESMIEPPCILPQDLVKALVKKIMADFPSGKERERYLKFLQDDVLKYFHMILEEETVRFFARAFEEEANDILGNYLDQLDMWGLGNKTSMINPEGEEIRWDENKLKLVEDALKVSNSSNFRETVKSNINSLQRRGQKVRWRDYPPLQEGIEKLLVEKFRPIIRTLIGAKHLASGSEEERKQSEALIEMRRLGYRECCIDRLVKYIQEHVYKS